MLAIICILAWATVCLFVIGLAMKGEHELVRKRIDALRLSLDEDIELVAPELTLPFDERVLRPWLRNLSTTFSRFLPSNAAANVGAKLDRAGNPWKLKPTEYIGLKTISLVIFSVGGVIIALFGDMSAIYRVIAMMVSAVIGLTLPDCLLEQAIRERQRIIRKALPDCLDLLVVSAEAGLGFDAALAKVVERAHGPLPDEFRKVLQDMSVGRSRMEALRAMANRVGMPELTTFVAAIHQADLLGVSIAHVLRVQADSLRVQRNLRARESAAKLPVKLLFPLILFIFPSIFVVILGPGIIQIYRTLIYMR